MISHKHRCIFIHIPKCAGTSIEYALGHFDNHEGRAGQDHRSVRMICQPGPRLKALSNLDNTKDYIRRIRENFRSHPNPENGIMPDERQYSDYFKFTIVRNPLDRAYSWYKNAMRDPIHQKNYRIDPTLDFTNFIFKFAGKGFLRPQTYWLKDYNGKLAMDYTGKFENLKEDYKYIANKIGIESTELPHKIESKKSENYSSIDDKAINFINEFYAEDFEKFHYPKN